MKRDAMSSTSKELIVAENVAREHIEEKGGREGDIVIWEYQLTNGRRHHGDVRSRG